MATKLILYKSGCTCDLLGKHQTREERNLGGGGRGALPRVEFSLDWDVVIPQKSMLSVLQLTEFNSLRAEL